MTGDKILEIVIIPIAIILLPLVWRLTATWLRRIQFQELIFREIEEIGPYPSKKKEKKDGQNWTDHHSSKTEEFIHRKIFKNPTENRDFILSLKSDLVYYVTQLWNAQWKDAEQWIYMISKIEAEIPFWQKSRCEKIRKMKMAWYILMKEYNVKFSDGFEEKYCCM